MKWALKAALFPVQYHPERPTKYPANDGLNWAGIEFPTPLKHIGKLEKQNPALTINVYGWEKDDVTILWISDKLKTIRRTNLMLLEKDGNTHYCLIKRLSALLYSQTKHKDKKYFCKMCLIGFTMADILARHTIDCNGVNGRPTKIEMPERAKTP